jgi:hypothetical protein
VKKKSAIFVAILGLSLLGCANLIAQESASRSTNQDVPGSLGSPRRNGEIATRTGSRQAGSNHATDACPSALSNDLTS